MRALRSIKDRVKELGANAIKWAEVVKLDFAALLDGELNFTINIPGAEKFPPRLRGALTFITEIIPKAFKFIVKMCCTVLKAALALTRFITQLVQMFSNPQSLMDMVVGIDYMDVLRMPGTIKSNAKEFAKVPTVLQALFGTVKMVLTEMKDALTKDPEPGPEQVPPAKAE